MISITREEKGANVRILLWFNGIQVMVYQHDGAITIQAPELSHVTPDTAQDYALLLQAAIVQARGLT